MKMARERQDSFVQMEADDVSPAGQQAQRSGKFGADMIV